MSQNRLQYRTTPNGGAELFRRVIEPSGLSTAPMVDQIVLVLTAGDLADLEDQATPIGGPAPELIPGTDIPVAANDPTPEPGE